MTQTQLEAEIVKYQKAYYDGNELISDAEFDKLWDELKSNYPDSIVLKKVGEDTVKGQKIKHWMTMGSQSKFNTEEGFDDWLRKENIQFPLLVQDKLDGNAICLQYRNGKLLHGVTRGNAVYGENADKAVFNMPSVPKTINEKADIAIRGEVIMNRSVFEVKYSDFANPRNLTAGLIKNEEFNHYEDLRFIAYDTNKKFTTETQKYNWLKDEKFDVVNTIIVNSKSELQTYRNSRNIHDKEYNIDGLVLRQNIIDPEDTYRVLPNKIHAYKWPSETVETVFLGVDWNMQGNTLTPVAMLEPIEINGSTVKRASLANPALIAELGLRIGDVVEVCKRGEIIPKIERVVVHCGMEDVEIPTVCPKCGSPLSLRENRTRLYCDNETCVSHFAARLDKWINIFDVKGLGPAMQQTILDSGVTSISQLYSSSVKDTVKAAVGINADKAFTDLYQKTATVTLDRLIAGFNLANIGPEMSKTLVAAGFTTDNIYPLTKNKLINIPGWSDIRAEKFSVEFNKNWEEMKSLESVGVHIINSTKKPEGLKICVTGKLENFSRKSVNEFIENRGHNSVDSVTRDTDILVTNDPNFGSSKNKNAQKFGIKIISEKELINMLGGLN